MYIELISSIDYSLQSNSTRSFLNYNAIKRISLAGNQINVIDELPLSELTALTILNLNRNSIQHIGAHHFLDPLKEVYLQSNGGPTGMSSVVDLADIRMTDWIEGVMRILSINQVVPRCVFN